MYVNINNVYYKLLTLKNKALHFENVFTIRRYVIFNCDCALRFSLLCISVRIAFDVPKRVLPIRTNKQTLCFLKCLKNQISV